MKKFIQNTIDEIIDQYLFADETKGKATATDSIVMLSDANPFDNNQRLNGKSVLTYDLIKESTKHFMGDLIDV